GAGAAKSAKAKPAAQTKPAAGSPSASGRSPKRTAKVVPTPAEAKAARRARRVARAALRPAAPEPVSPKTTIDELKDKIMANTTSDFTQPISEAIGDLQTRARAAYEKSTEVATEVTEFTKGNVEAVVESTKIFATGAQSLGKSYVEEAKSAYETVTADVKEL